MTAERQAAYFNPHLPIDERINDLLARMTIDEKIGQLMQLNAEDDLADEIQNKHVGSILHTSPERLRTANQLVQQTRLRIPLLVGDDLIRGFSFWPGATIFPEALGQSLSWDVDKVQQVGRVTAEEGSAAGEQWTFSPVLCIARDDRWGRVDETYGEDPYLIGEMGAALTRGLQKNAKAGDKLDKDAILACAKHFAGYSQTQGGRDATENDLTHRGLLSWFLPPFERVAREGVGTFMLGYESIDGVPVTINHWLLHDVLRGQWNYKGTLITDWDNCGQLVRTQKLEPDFAHAAAASVNAGNDMIMTTPEFYDGAHEAIRQGLLSVATIDEAVRRILTLKFRLGLFEDPRLPDEERIRTVIGSAQHTHDNLAITRESMALLHNNGILPLVHGITDEIASDQTEKALHETGVSALNGASSSTHSIALIGPLIDDPQEQIGDWAGASGQANWMNEEHPEPRESVTTIVDGFTQLLPHGWTLRTAQGAGIVEMKRDPKHPTFPDGQPMPPIPTPCTPHADMIATAVDAAKKSDVVVAVVGDTIALTGEGRSTATLELMGAQNALLDALAATGTPMVVVLMSGKPLILHQAALNADALLWVPKPGMQGGRAIAETILGLVNPSGRLTISFPRHAGQIPIYYNMVRGGHQYRYADLPQTPQFAFGQGKGYSHFAYAHMHITNDGKHGQKLTENDTLHASIDVTNTGSRTGTEIVQLYISDVVTSVTWADRELKAFQRITLQPGETKTVHFDLPISACNLVNAQCQRVVEPGDFTMMIGHSSLDADLLTAPFTVAPVSEQ
jgi:beta-glucosidase